MESIGGGIKKLQTYNWDDVLGGFYKESRLLYHQHYDRCYLKNALDEAKYNDCQILISTDKRSGQEHGTPRQMKKLDEHRSRMQNQFNLFYTLSRNELATGCIRSEATKAMYEEFGTGRREVFQKKLESGKYDSGFIHEKKQQRARAL